jgi:DNA-binding NarL/FixJ family response regulator
VQTGRPTLLESQPGVEVCSEASSGAETMERANEHKPDLVILERTMHICEELAHDDLPFEKMP